jgi:hypothetical protein
MTPENFSPLSWRRLMLGGGAGAVFTVIVITLSHLGPLGIWSTTALMIVSGLALAHTKRGTDIHAFAALFAGATVGLAVTQWVGK